MGAESFLLDFRWSNSFSKTESLHQLRQAFERESMPRLGTASKDV